MDIVQQQRGKNQRPVSGNQQTFSINRINEEKRCREIIIQLEILEVSSKSQTKSILHVRIRQKQNHLRKIHVSWCLLDQQLLSYYQYSVGS